jgi:hypothetical protein
MTLAAAAAPVVLPHQGADQALLRRLMEQEKIARTVPGVDWTEYLVTLARAVIDALGDLLSPAGDAIRGLGLSMEGVSRVVLALLAVMVLAIAVTFALRLLRQRRRPAAVPVEAAATLPPAPRDPAAWRGALEERLRAGGIAEALEAAWWWLAASVSRGPVDPSWTSRELLARAGRGDLAHWAATLDRMTYGPRRPMADELRRLVDALDASV